MPAELLHGIIPQIPFNVANITLIEGEGQFSSGGTLNLFFQGRNRAGYTEPSSLNSSIIYSATQAIRIEFPDNARTEATDYHYYIISHSLSGEPEDAIALFHWTNYEPDQETPRTLLPVILYRDEHLRLAPSVAVPSDLPTGDDLIDGMTRLVIGGSGIPTSAYYKYEKYETRSPNGVTVLQPHSTEKWVRTGSPNVGAVNDIFDVDGCAQSIDSIDVDDLIKPPSYAADGTRGTPLKIIYRNDDDSAIPAGTPFDLSVILNGEVASQLFDGKLLLMPRGFVDLTDGSLDTGDGIGGTMPYIDEELPYTYGDRSTLVLHKDLPPGKAYYLEVAPYFQRQQFKYGLLEGSQISVLLNPATQSGDPASAIWRITGDIVLSDGDRLRVVPGIGLQAKMLSGSALIQRFVFPTKSDRAVYGIQPNLSNQQITIDGNGSLFYRGVKSVNAVPRTEVVRALVSCNTGYSKVSEWSNAVSVSAGGSLQVTLAYPCDEDGYGTVRSDYPVLAGSQKGNFNPPYVQLFVLRNSDSKIFQIGARVTVLPDRSQATTIDNLSSAIEVTVLPTTLSSNFCLFAPPSVAIAATGGGSLASDTYSVAAAYYFDGSAISSVSHSTEEGCVYEAGGHLSDVFEFSKYWAAAVLTPSLLRSVPVIDIYPYQTRYVISKNRLAHFDLAEIRADDNIKYFKPNTIAASSPGRWVLEETNFWQVGNGNPSASVGNLGDLYLNASTGGVWSKVSATTWNNVGNIRGTQGEAASVAIGEVELLSPGSAPTVINSGTEIDATLNFGIPAGIPGEAATIAVGTTTTLPPGSSAFATNSGTSSAAIFNFAIPQGSQGLPGTAATISVGSVASLAPGSTPTVENVGSASAASLNFGIPQGMPGTASTVAVDSVTTLSAGSLATVQNVGTATAAQLRFGIPKGDAAATIAIGTVNALPPGSSPTVTNSGNTSNVVLNFGLATGSTGATGTAASVSVGTVSSLPSGSTPTVANAGTANAAVLNFGIPQGSTGATGPAGAIAIDSVTTLPAGSPATVQNVGTATAAQLRFGIPKGDAAATIAVQSVTALPPGNTPTVTNSGSSSNVQLNFGIPSGATGATGSAGTIAIGTVQPSPSGGSPAVTNSGTSTAAILNFILPRGVAGETATIEIGDVELLPPGSSPTVSNSGSASAAVFDFGIPAGAPGATGSVAAAGGYILNYLSTPPATGANQVAIFPDANDSGKLKLRAASNGSVRDLGSESDSLDIKKIWLFG